MSLKFKKAAEVISAVSRRTVNRYLRYWKTLEPRGDREYYERWLFAFMSVRTQWQRNVELFERLRSLPEGFTQEQLRQTLVESGAGMIQVRTKGVWKFHTEFWRCPRWWYPGTQETFVACRDRLAAQIYGLGIAKVSFVLEMAFPETCEVVCADTHILQLYGTNGDKVTENNYRRVEDHWVGECRKRALPSAMTRHVYWDKLHNADNTAYWSYVFERARSA